MYDAPWLTIVGLGEDGPDGLSPASRDALAAAEVVAGARRHLALLPELTAERMEWPVPFAEGIPQLLALRRRRVVMLASGDPFWFGAGSSVTRQLEPGEWRALPGVSTFSLAAARLGWPLERVTCLGLHAEPVTRLRPHLAQGQRVLTLLRDGAAVRALADWLTGIGFGGSRLWVLEALGGPRERIRETTAERLAFEDIVHPVTVALLAKGRGMPAVSGLADGMFDHDGQMTKRPMRALTLSALAPRPGERLWDIGAGSGSVGIEWLLAHPETNAVAIEADPARAARARANAERLGVDRLQVVEGRAPEALSGLPAPDAVFIGGGLSDTLLSRLWEVLPESARVVANAVTLESEALLADWQTRVGGDLLRIELAEARPIGTRRGWRASFPMVQWSVQR